MKTIDNRELRPVPKSRGGYHTLTNNDEKKPKAEKIFMAVRRSQDV
jgi:hypothetical protein